MADRGEIRLREGNIGDLIDIYRRSYEKLTKEIISATEAGKIQKARTMVGIRKTLSAYGYDVAKWVQSEIPQYYLDGANVAIQDLKSLGVKLSDARGLGVIDREAIKALTDEVSLGFAESIRGVARNAERILDDALKQQLNFIIADGKLTGETKKMIAARIKERLEQEGLSGLVDKGGRNWQLDTYSNMLARTKSVESRNLGLQNRMLRNGYDLVQVSNHRTTHKACARWEGRILSLTGKTPGYPTLAEAKDSGLFHPNCQHAINVINMDLAAITHAYDNPYLKGEGEPPIMPKNLPAAPPAGQMMLRTAPPKARGGTVLDPTSLLDITKANKLRLEHKGTAKTIEVTQAESRFIVEQQLLFVSGKSDIFARSQTTLGVYQHSTRALFIRDPAHKNAAKTFYHELGHAIDYRFNTSRLSRDRDVLNAIVQETTQVVKYRLLGDRTIKPEAAEAWAAGRSYEGKSLSRTALKYARSREEVFADAYGQYRVDPDKFRTYAPMLYKVFKELGL